jgi:hypothetical protein
LIRVALALFALTALAGTDARSAAAEIYRPWCVSYPASTTKSCAFTSFEQCMMTAGPGTGGVCVQNPWKPPRWADTRASLIVTPLTPWQRDCVPPRLQAANDDSDRRGWISYQGRVAVEFVHRSCPAYRRAFEPRWVALHPRCRVLRREA